MSNVIRDVVTDLLDEIGRDQLKDLMFEPIDMADVEQHLARLSVLAAPSYLPIAVYDGSLLAIHLWPGRDIRESPIVYLPHDEHGAQYICKDLTKLPCGLWLWVARYFKERQEILRNAVETITANIAGAQPVSEELWSLLTESPSFEPTWWTPDCSEHTERAWHIGDVGHPFVGLPRIPFEATAEHAISLLQPFVNERSDCPELLSILLAAYAKAGMEPDRESILNVLSAEAWRRLECLLSGFWRLRGRGVCEWDATLRSIEDPEALLEGTEYHALAGHPDTYSEEDEQGPNTLIRLAQQFRETGDREVELRQLRNAALLQVLVWGGWRPQLAELIAESCAAIAPNSPASHLALESARVSPQRA